MPKSKPDPAKVTPATAPLTAFNPVAAQAWMEMTSACSTFALDRMQKALAAQQAMMTCASPAALMQVHSDYCRDAAQDYSKQTARMMALMTSATGQRAADGTSPFSRKYDDVPL
ncbi:phasin family protein [Tateyamaria sp. syn59]|uniref:phasin family protein n=1 Tax=Tateyamaria sp. syn59 TaxID=2576942 RepID=UPI0011BE43DF|nr:phasin family protein [Tateyamaria sp. syn59]